MANMTNPEITEIVKETPVIKDPFRDYVTIKIEKDLNKEDSFFAAVNGKTYNIQRGIKVKVPRPVYEALKQRERQIEKFDNYVAKIEEQAKSAFLK